MRMPIKTDILAQSITAHAEISLAIFASIEYLFPKYASTINSITVFTNSANIVKPITKTKMAISILVTLSHNAAIRTIIPIIMSALKFLWDLRANIKPLKAKLKLVNIFPALYLDIFLSLLLRMSLYESFI